MSVGAIRVVVVDDHEVVRRGLRSYFSELDDVVLVAEATDGVDALEKMEELASRGTLPDIALVDLVMRRLDGIATIEALRSRYPSMEILVVTSFGETQRIRSALAAGATGYVLKDADVDEIHQAIVAAHKGIKHLDPAIETKLSETVDLPHRGLGSLTPRERDILVLIARGHSNRDIATTLQIAERTVTMHITSIFGKIDVVSRTQAALWAVREGLLPIEKLTDGPHE